MYTHEVHTASWLTYKAVDRSALITSTRIQVHIAHMLTGMWEYMHWMTSCLHLHTNPKTHISGTVHVVTSSTLLLKWGNYLYVQCTSNILSCQCEFFEPVSKDKLTTIGVLPNNAIIAMYVWIHNNWDVLYNAANREIDGRGGGEERRGWKWKWMWPPNKIHVYVNVGVTTVYMYCLEQQTQCKSKCYNNAVNE